MHELSIATSLVDIAVRNAAEHGAQRVTRLHLRIGALSGIEPDALTFSFPIAARDTLCEDAELVIERVAADATCPACGKSSQVTEATAPCPHCGSWPLGLTGGREMTLDSLEVD